MVKKPTQKKDAEQRVIESALQLATTHGWRYVTLHEIAETAEMPEPELLSHLPTKGALFGILTRRTDRLMLDHMAPEEPDETVRERLFDILMTRFDLLAPYRGGIAAVLQGSIGDPCVLLMQICNIRSSMKLTLEAAGVSTAGPFGSLRLKGLCGIYLTAFRVWLKDDSPDKSKTMATLDRALNQAERFARQFSRA